MAKFIYKAKKGLEEKLEGVIEAANEEEALSKLAAQGVFTISIEEASAAIGAAQQKTSPLKKKAGHKINSNDIYTFIQKLSTLIRARVELLSCLKILYEQAENPRFQAVVLEMYNSTKEGKTFSESFEKFPNVFPPLFANIVKAGEASGRLDLALTQINEFLAREEALRTKIKVALAYPALLLMVGIASIFVLINFVIPKLKPIFANLGGNLPLITKLLLDFSDFSRKSWWLVLGIIVLAAVILYYQKGNVLFKKLLIGIKRNVPVLKRLSRNEELAHFSRSLSLLIESGVPALKSMDIATLGVSDPQLKSGLTAAARDVASGQTISKCLERHTNLPDFFTKMIAVGEESGRLTEVLREITNSYTQQVEADVALISAMLEPLLILGLGLVLGTIVLSILLPVFQVTQMVH
ncbi:MAG: type II secretion system F family protein [Candidatus Omnitrophica bacterium]|nr:type II secretion system F family protein [Candidatus Omnitrophota bacterium]